MKLNYIHHDNDDAFVWSSSFGYLDVAKWLYVKSRTHNSELYTESRTHDSELYSFGGVDIHSRDDYVFRWSCEYDNLKFVKWLFDVGKFDAKFIIETIFCNLQYYKSDLILFLCDQVKLNGENTNKIIIECSEKDMYRVIIKLFKQYKNKITDETKYTVYWNNCIYKNFKLAKLMFKYSNALKNAVNKVNKKKYYSEIVYTENIACNIKILFSQSQRNPKNSRRELIFTNIKMRNRILIKFGVVGSHLYVIWG